MEDTPARIAADILIAAIEAKNLATRTDPQKLAEAFEVIHAAVVKAAAKDVEENLSYPHK